MNEVNPQAAKEQADFASFMEAMRESDPVWQDRVVTAFTSSVSTRDWALLVSEPTEESGTSVS